MFTNLIFEHYIKTEEDLEALIQAFEEYYPKTFKSFRERVKEEGWSVVEAAKVACRMCDYNID